MPSNYVFIDRDKVVMMLIKYRCKLADCKSKENQKREFLNTDSLSKRKKQNVMNCMICFHRENIGVISEKK